MKDTTKAMVKGHDVDGNEFEAEVLFRLDRPGKDESYYGTGCYMNVTVPWDKMGFYVDVRYERTTDIEMLAHRWISGYFGKNAESVKFIEE